MGNIRQARGASTDGDITFVCPVLCNESASRTLERRLIVMLAGPEWELFAAVQSSRRQVLMTALLSSRISQTCGIGGMHRRALKSCIEDAQQEAAHIRSLRNDRLINIAPALDTRGVLDDSELRAFFTQDL